ncbi:hypothetical protein FIA58_009905 [Flavobacterium jejuense]|uniref:Uncharacterized protein n=1 Tax=Flavobacterium jejuense TaxID=1544455 RepID=A0ABX0IQ69_9FLAO|nr:hypothetical protein [Flavobacterium jejuense]NHN25987.1 hypothetical protein [Flavobacterium jejuense]
MKKALFLILFGLFLNVSAQEVKSIYTFKKEQQKKLFHYSELDSLVLYNNGNFYRCYHYKYHEIHYSELKGNWSIENGLLYLNATANKSSVEDVEDKEWLNCNEVLTYCIKKKQLIPFETHFKSYAKQCLKLIE